MIKRYKNQKFKRKARSTLKLTKSNISGRPVLYVFRSNKKIYAQIVDVEGNTLTAGLGPKSIDGSIVTGRTIAKSASKKGIKDVIFNRGSYKYHGRIKALADAARAEGLNF